MYFLLKLFITAFRAFHFVWRRATFGTTLIKASSVKFGISALRQSFTPQFGSIGAKSCA